MKSVGVHINEDGSATIVYPSDGSLSGLASRTFTRECWLVTCDYFKASVPELKMSRREALVEVASNNNEKIHYRDYNTDFFKLVRLALRKCGLDPDENTAFKRMCGLAREMIQEGEI